MAYASSNYDRTYRFVSELVSQAEGDGWTINPADWVTISIPTKKWGPASGDPAGIKSVVGTLKLPVNKHLSELFTLVFAEVQRRGYDLIDGWCWGAEEKVITGSTSGNISLHAAGRAVDVNAPSNPQSSDLITDLPDWYPDFIAHYGFRWGGDYQNSKKDSMHLEFIGTTDDAAKATAAAQTEIGSVPIPTSDLVEALVATQADKDAVTQIVQDVTAPQFAALQKYILQRHTARYNAEQRILANQATIVRGLNGIAAVASVVRWRAGMTMNFLQERCREHGLLPKKFQDWHTQETNAAKNNYRN